VPAGGCVNVALVITVTARGVSAGAETSRFKCRRLVLLPALLAG